MKLFRRFLRRFLSPFFRLQGKLTLSYTVTTVLAQLLLAILFFLALFGIFMVLVPMPEFYQGDVEDSARKAAPLLLGEPDRHGLQSMSKELESHFDFDPFMAARKYVVVVDSAGRVLASSGEEAPAINTQIGLRLSGSPAQQLQDILHGKSKTALYKEKNFWLVMAPIEGRQQVLGALVLHISDLHWKFASIFWSFLLLLLILGVLLFLFAGTVGMIFGFAVSRGLTRRFNHLNAIVDRWSRGDFSLFAKDTSRDEVGYLARQLNRMAEQLRGQLQMRQKLATLEERNRLARDLHDSVKQQVFAVSMQLSTVKGLMSRDQEAAQKHLYEAEHLVRQVQQELTALIRELRPVGLEGKGLALALQEYALHWQQQTCIPAVVRIQGEHPLGLEVEEALYRVMQEALSNIARHSKATSVELQLRYEEDAVFLEISDNGIGFQVEAARGKGVGLLSIEERIEAINGSVTIESERDMGTTLCIHCPLTQKDL
ncbi:two-component system, NarL family, sensor histidine kinase LiaS [Thermosporothrix hazakensis]|uniref:Oxygen sensor histidine kinase NreB n=2 Tax=Thermosporothrix TaxID=768650 RepID=A0A326U4V8_THEHA|nr:histidine kinase [Thermosporothrix hazakensis]PZW26392.1 two-component system, NarL family, sensor histidine kinase LiaS [Thermosporothrix hazakensis]BBH90605.1 hypothetical protein KTC_53560 [Thermosporothrix sp. COM3]GCE48656.1 hypothetical protein KTH_35250 [Thermosporothrix hazakensis]